MSKDDLFPYRLNSFLKESFKNLNLDLEEVMEFTPDDLNLENGRLHHLLDFIEKYRLYGSKEAMESVLGPYLYPPIFPGIDPWSDWYRFELWLEGKPTRLSIRAQLPAALHLPKPEEVRAEELETILVQLKSAMLDAGFDCLFQDDIPAPLIYQYLYEQLDEVYELDYGGGFWNLDGCSGWCPGCFQRPWCEFGQQLGWAEDETAGKMHLIDELKDYVSATPQSPETIKAAIDAITIDYSGKGELPF